MILLLNMMLMALMMMTISNCWLGKQGYHQKEQNLVVEEHQLGKKEGFHFLMMKQGSCNIQLVVEEEQQHKQHQQASWGQLLEVQPKEWKHL